MNSDDLKKLTEWKRRLQNKRDGIPMVEPDESKYDAPARNYDQMPGEVKLLFDALSDVIEAVTKS